MLIHRSQLGLSAFKNGQNLFTTIYSVFGVSVLLIYLFENHRFVETMDHFLTLAAAFQALAFILLALKIRHSGSISGVSRKMLVLYLVAQKLYEERFGKITKSIESFVFKAHNFVLGIPRFALVIYNLATRIRP